MLPTKLIIEKMRVLDYTKDLVDEISNSTDIPRFIINQRITDVLRNEL